MIKNNDFFLFSELYTCYYQVVAQILDEAKRNPITRLQMEKLAREYGHDESALSIVPGLLSGRWPLLTQDGQHPGSYRSRLKRCVFPQGLTGLQKSWLKALMSDPRLKLFFTDCQLKELEQWLENVKPLCRMSDFCLFDQYADHDPFSSVMYRKHMLMILNALHSRQFVSISYMTGKKHILTFNCLPCRLEYGQRDGKFRLYAMSTGKSGRRRMDVLNVARILSLKETGNHYPEPVDVEPFLDRALCREPVVLEITTERNGLERAMLHFSCYQKKVERLEETGTYRCTIYYDKRWETELLIQILSFGPVIKVLGPESFILLIRERVRNQSALPGKANVN